MHRLPNINDKLYIYATPSGLLLITSDLKDVYYSLYMDIDVKKIGLFEMPYNIYEAPRKIAEGDYGIASDLSILKIFSDFENTDNVVIDKIALSYPLFKNLCHILLKFVDPSCEKPFTHYINIDSAKDIATLVANDCKTMCAFKIPTLMATPEPCKMLLHFDRMIGNSLDFPVEIDTKIIIQKISDMDDEYKPHRLQISCGDYIFIEKQHMNTYPAYQNVLSYYDNQSRSDIVDLTNDCKTAIKAIQGTELNSTFIIKLEDFNKILKRTSAPMDNDIYFDVKYVQKVFLNTTSNILEVISGQNKEQMQIRCTFGKENNYQQRLAFMPIDPSKLRADEYVHEERKKGNPDEPMSSCSIKTIKDLI